MRRERLDMPRRATESSLADRVRRALGEEPEPAQKQEEQERDEAPVAVETRQTAAGRDERAGRTPAYEERRETPRPHEEQKPPARQAPAEKPRPEPRPQRRPVSLVNRPAAPATADRPAGNRDRARSAARRPAPAPSPALAPKAASAYPLPARPPQRTTAPRAEPAAPAPPASDRARGRAWTLLASWRLPKGAFAAAVILSAATVAWSRSGSWFPTVTAALVASGAVTLLEIVLSLVWRPAARRLFGVRHLPLPVYVAVGTLVAAAGVAVAVWEDLL